MVNYKIYDKGNYIYLENINTGELFSGAKKTVEVNPNNKGRAEYRFYNVKDWTPTNSLKLEQIKKEDGSAYTLEEWKTFYTENTATFSLEGGSTPITGFSTETTLSALNNKVPNKGQATSNNSTPVVIANDQSAIPTTPRANTSGIGGTTAYKLISTASTNANVVKASAGNLYSIIAIGVTSTVRYLKLYNKATTPTVDKDVPIMTIPIPANTQGAGVCLPFSMGVNFSNGISIAITANLADNDATAIGAGDVIVNLTHA